MKPLFANNQIDNQGKVNILFDHTLLGPEFLVPLDFKIKAKGAISEELFADEDGPVSSSLS